MCTECHLLVKPRSGEKHYVRLRFSRRRLWRMPSSGMWRRGAFVITDVSEERIASITEVESISELGTTLADSFHPDDTFLRTVFYYKAHPVTHPRRRHSTWGRHCSCCYRRLCHICMLVIVLCSKSVSVGEIRKSLSLIPILMGGGGRGERNELAVCKHINL
jgi:hypothetical protein